MRRPVKPNEDDCCNNGCNPCVFDVYEKRLKEYQLLQNDKNETLAGTILTHNAISDVQYTSFTIVYIKQLCDSHKIIAYKRINCSDGSKVRWKPGHHFLCKCEAKKIKCSKAFTPIKDLQTLLNNLEYDFFIIVKRYKNGFGSNYLYNTSVGDSTLWRGPYGTFEYNPNYSRIIMLGQGTGIAPLMSIIQTILNDETNMTRIVLYFCCQSTDHILLRDELYFYKSFWNFSYKVFLKIYSPNSKYQEPLVYHKLSTNDLTCLKPFSLKDQIILCGSGDFTELYKSFLIEEKNLTIQSISII